MDFVTFYKDNFYKRYEREQFDSFVHKRKLKLDSPVIHVAGTAGKGCTCRLLEGIYHECGYKVGTFFSTFFESPCECIHVGAKEISEEEFQKQWSEIEKDVKKFDLSPFEALVAIAYRVFNENKVKLSIVECGIGGESDATNLDTLNTRLAIITNVGLDHTSYLGTTTSQIASNCGGIVKEKCPLLCGPLDETSSDALRDIVGDLKSNINYPDAFHFQHLVGPYYHFDYGQYKDLTVNTFAEYELQNAILALETTKLLAEEFPVNEEGIRKGLMIEMLPGRCERFENITLDTAENVTATQALIRCARSISKGAPLHVIFATLQGKNIAVDLPLLGNNSATIYLTTFDHPFAKTEMDYFLYSADHPYFQTFQEALDDLKTKYPEEPILVTGSNEFVGYVRSILKNK